MPDRQTSHSASDSQDRDPQVASMEGKPPASGQDRSARHAAAQKDREARLAAALRANLVRRKAQARARSALPHEEE